MEVCRKCGAPIGEGSAFCSSCGTKIKEKPKRSAAGIIFLFVGIIVGAAAATALVLLINKSKDAGVVKIEGSGYDSPEDAVTAYVEYLKAGDMDGIISTFAVESYMEHYDPKAYYEFTTSYFPYIASGTQMNAMVLGDSELSGRLNAENRRAYITSWIYKQYMGAVLSDESNEEIKDQIDGGRPIRIPDDMESDELMDFLECDPKFDDLEIDDFVPVSDYYKGAEEIAEKYDERKEKQWDADGVENICLELEIGREDYVLFMTVVRYGDKWYNAEFCNYAYYSMGFSSIYGGLVPKEEF